MITHLLANVRTYAAAVLLIGGAILSANVLPDTEAKDLGVVVAISAAIAVPSPKRVKVEPVGARRQE